MNHFIGMLSNVIIVALTVTSVHGSFGLNPKSFLDPKTLINPTTVGALARVASGEDPKLVAAQTGMQVAAQNLQNQNSNGQQAGQVNTVPGSGFAQVPPYQQQSTQGVSQPPLLNNPYDQTAPQTAPFNQQQQQFNQAPVGPQSTQYNGVQSTQYNGQVSSGQTLPPPSYPGQTGIPGYTYPPNTSAPPPAYTGYGNVPPPGPVGYTNVTPGQNQGFNTQPQGFNQQGFYNGQAQPQQYGRVY